MRIAIIIIPTALAGTYSHLTTDMFEMFDDTLGRSDRSDPLIFDSHTHGTFHVAAGFGRSLADHQELLVVIDPCDLHLFRTRSLSSV